MVTKKDIRKMVQDGAATRIESGKWFNEHRYTTVFRVHGVSVTEAILVVCDEDGKCYAALNNGICQMARY